MRLGKTNLRSPSPTGSFNPIYGTTKNPLDITRRPGGSSAGSAAALAAGYVPLELGSDSAVPSGYRRIRAASSPTSRLPVWSRTRPCAAALVGVGDRSDKWTGVCGRSARTAADLSLALDALVGADEPEAPLTVVRFTGARRSPEETFVS